MSAPREPPPPLSQRKRQHAPSAQVMIPVTQLQLSSAAGYASGSQSARTAAAPPPGRRPRAQPRPRVHMHEEPVLSSARSVPAHHHQHKTDSGLRAAKVSMWDAQAKPAAFTIPLSAIAPAATTEEEKNVAAGAATERVLIGRSEAIKRELAKITQPHTAFIRAPPAAAATADNAAAAATHSVSFAAGSPAISASASVSSLVSPRRVRLLSEHKQQQSSPDSLSHSASASLFTNSHHFRPLAVPSPPQPLKVPIVLLTAAADGTAPVVGSGRAANEQSSQSLAPSSSTAQLVYESETSTARLLPAASMSSLHPSASNASLQPSASAVSLQRYADTAAAAAPVSYFSNSPAVQSISNLHVAAPHPLLAVSSSLGALPYGMTVSESYATLGNQSRSRPLQQSHVQSSPSMPRFGGASTHASTAALSAAQSAAALYPAELTVDNSALIQRRLRELIRENGYSYRASNNVLHGELGDSSDELSDSERRRYRAGGAASSKRKQRRSHSRKLIHSKTSRAPKPSWHQAGVESVAASAQAFPALFGLVDAGSALRKRKRAERLEGERAQAAAHQEAARLDGTRAVTAVPTNDDDAATSTPLSPRNLIGGEKLAEGGTAGPPALLRRSSNVLVPLDLASKAVSTAVLAPAGMGAQIADPLQPRGSPGSKPSLIGAAVRVLLRRELHPTTQDANAVGVRQLDRVAARDAAAAFAVKKEKKLGLMDVVAASAFGEGDLTAATGTGDEPEQSDSAYGSSALARVYNSDAIAIAPKGSEAAATTALARAFNASSHSHAHAAAVAQRGAKRAQRVSMEKWLELRLKKHKKVLKEEDRLRARELFDMIASSSASDRRKEDGSLMRIGERERDPLQATVELEGMRRALKGLGMDSSCEELAFRLQKLSEYHRNARAAAASGLVVPGSTGGSKSARVDGSGPNLSSRKGAPALSSVGTVSARTGELRLAFNDFLAVYDHISNWDELLQLRHLKRHKAEQQRAQEAAQAVKERRRRRAGGESSGTEGTEQSDASSPRRLAGAHRHAASTSSLASPNSNSGSLRALHAQHQKQIGSPSATTTTESSAVAATAGSRPVIPPLALDTALTASSSMASLPSRTDEALRRVDLPFFLWVPAHHRSKKINDLITLYGLPSTVGVGIGLDTDREKEATAGSKPNSPRKALTARSTSKKDLRQPRSTRAHRKTAAAAADSGSDSDAAAASPDKPDRDGSSSSEEDLSAPGRATPVAIERHLVDELHPTKLPAVASASASPTASPRSPLRSPGSRSRRASAAISSSGKKTTPGEYWGSQQVMRALHYKNLTLSSSTMQKQTVLTHETIAPGALLSPLSSSGHHRSLSGSTSTAASPSGSPVALVRRPTSRGVITPLPVGKRSLAPTPIPSVPENEPFVPVPKISVDLAAATDKPLASAAVASKIPELSDVAQRVAAEAERTTQEVARFVEEVRLNMQRVQAAEIAAEELRAQEEARAKAEEEAKQQLQVELTPEQSAAKESSAKEDAAKDAAIQAALTLHAHVAHTEGRAKTKKKKNNVGASNAALAKSVSPVTARARATQKAAAAAASGAASVAVVPFNSTSVARGAMVQRDKDLEAAAAKEAAAAAAEEARTEVMQLTDPMIKAAKSGAWEDVLMLIQTSAGDSVRERARYVNRRDKNGSSAIMHCVWPGHFRVLEVLLYHGADPNAVNTRLNTALHLCCEKGHRRLIKLLIEMGAAIDLRNWQAKTCLDVIPLEEEVSLSSVSAAAQSNAGALVAAAPAPTVKVASEAADSLRAFVLECAADAKRKRDREREENGGLGMVSSTLALRAADQSFAEMNSKRDKASAAAQAAMEARPLTLYDPEGRPLLDLFELTAEDRRSAGIRGNFFGSDRIAAAAGGVSQSRTLSGQLLIHSAAHLTASASANAMGSYKAQYAQATSASGAAAAETRAKLTAALVRDELAHHSLSSLWSKTRAAVGARQTVVSSSDDLLASQESSRMDGLRVSMAQSERGMESLTQGGSRAARVEHFVQPAQEPQEERTIFRSETNNEAHSTIAEE